jgi:hypothetical protein
MVNENTQVEEDVASWPGDGWAHRAITLLSTFASMALASLLFVAFAAGEEVFGVGSPGQVLLVVEARKAHVPCYVVERDEDILLLSGSFLVRAPTDPSPPSSQGHVAVVAEPSTDDILKLCSARVGQLMGEGGGYPFFRVIDLRSPAR